VLALITPLALSKEEATLLAAGIAAVASVLKLIADVLSARGEATRAAHRATLEPYLAGLGKALHQVTAGVVLVHRRVKAGQEPGNAFQNAEQAAKSLKQLRLEVKYALAGADEALRILTRAPDWTATYKGDETGDQYITQLQELSKLVDQVVARSYRKGRPPTWYERRRLGKLSAKTRKSWEQRFGRDPEAI
jgi:hypothetical protein